MPEFRAANSHRYVVTIDVPTVKAVRDRAGIDMLDIKGGIVDRLMSDPVALVDTLWVICHQSGQATSEIEFAKQLVGDSILGAQEALFEALVDFFPSGQRDALRGAIDAQKKVRDRLLALAQETLAGTDQLIEDAEQAYRAQLNSGNERGSSPESSASATSAESLSAN